MVLRRNPIETQPHFHIVELPEISIMPIFNQNLKFLLLVIFFTGMLPEMVAQAQSREKLAKDPIDIAQTCKSIRQPKDAIWRTANWKTDLLDAQKLAVERQKPMFIWAMDGHPLGCT